MKYQYLRHDGFIYRRSPPPDDDFLDVKNIEKMETWDGTKWRQVLSPGYALEPLTYGMEISEEAAMQIGAEQAEQNAVESE